MGDTRVRVKICGQIVCEELSDVLVDTGASDTVISESLANKIGVTTKRIADVEIADGKIERMPMGEISIEIEGKEGTVPVLIGKKTVIGATTLEFLSFKVDPVKGVLEPRPRRI